MGDWVNEQTDSFEHLSDPTVEGLDTSKELTGLDGMEGMEELLPTLLQIFLTVGLGWLAGALGLFGAKESKGIGVFVGKFSLPALIFTSLATLDLSAIKWSFLLAMLIAKSAIFSLVMILEVALNRNASRASIFAICCTQANDSGMGLPILSSIFGPGHPLVGLLYLVAPISLLVLNPIGFILLEVGRGEKEKGIFSTIRSVIWGLITNPVVTMTLLGVLGNFAFSSSPPPTITKFLSALGAAFTALAPFSLGLSMVGKLGNMKGQNLKPILGLVAIKSIFCPMVTYLVVDEITALLDSAPDPSLSNFALLLGSFPPALGVLSYAVEYSVSVDLVSAAIVLTTLASAPLLYGVANILTATSVCKEDIVSSDHSWIDCILSIGSVAIVLAIILSRPSWRRGPHLFTLSLLFLTFVSSTAGLLQHFFQLPFLALTNLTALHATRLSAPFLAFLLLRITQNPLKPPSLQTTLLLMLPGPLLALSTFFLLLAPYSPEDFIVFSMSQDVVSLAVHTVALIPTLTILLFIFKLPPASLSGSQVFRHTILVAVLVAASFFSLALSLGKLIVNDSCYPGALQVLISLNSDLSSGQGFLFLAVFGLDQAAGLFSPIRKLLRHMLSCCGDAGEAFIMVDSSSSSSSSTSSTSSAPSTESSRRSSETSSPNDSICEKNSPLETALWVDNKSGSEVARL